MSITLDLQYRGDSAKILVEILVEPVYQKKITWKFPIYCEKECRKIGVGTQIQNP